MTTLHQFRRNASTSTPHGFIYAGVDFALARRLHSNEISTAASGGTTSCNPQHALGSETTHANIRTNMHVELANASY